VNLPRPVGHTRTPQMSIVLVTDSYEAVRQVMDRLRAQTVRDRLEIVIVCASRESLELDESELAGFAGVQVVELGSISPLAAGLAAGVRAATAAVVQLGETHAFPDRDWAEALIRAHAQPWAVVVPGIRNANPDGAISWANLLLDYGQFLDGLPAGEVSHTPTHNPAYKRALLLEFGDRLEAALSGGYEISVDWRAKGCRFYFQPAAKVAHANVSRPACWLQQRYLVGLVHAAERSQAWSRLRRVAYACAFPLIPPVVLSRILKSVRLLQRDGRLPPLTIPAMLVGSMAAALGEMVGYAGGLRPADKQRLDEYELHKTRYIRSRALATDAA
jgi:hypothetical protein